MAKALVIGKGKSGEAASSRLRALGYEVEFADGVDLVVTSPGVPVKSELQLGVEELKKRGVKLLAVTGSKGKSSVVKLVADAIGGVPCGNFGLPVSAARETKWAVVEVSSFQLETTTLSSDAFEAAALLNLQSDHLSRHGSLEVYHSLKRKLLTFTRRPIVAEANADARLFTGTYFDNDVLRPNGCAAVALMRVAGLDDAAITRAFRYFRPLPHRMEPVGVFGGVAYVDDSKATSIAALVAGVKMAKGRVRLIAGGLPKGDDPASALPVLTERVEKVYIIGQSAEAFAAAWKGKVDCEICGTLDQAVATAKREAVEGEMVILSPGAASFDQFENFEQRGEVFAKLVKKEG